VRSRVVSVDLITSLTIVIVLAAALKLISWKQKCLLYISIHHYLPFIDASKHRGLHKAISNSGNLVKVSLIIVTLWLL